MNLKNVKLLGIILLVMLLWGCKKVPPTAVNTEVEVLDITASEAWSSVIKEDATFTLTTSAPVTEAHLKENLEVSPQVDYTLKTLSDTAYELVPTAPLAPGSVISLKHYNNARVAGWAFQVGDALAVQSAYPANGADAVPVNTGIEITFNNPIDEGILAFLTVEPAVAYEHKIEANKITLIPNGLEEDVRYVVRLSKGYENRVAKVLSADFETAFITSGQSTAQLHTEMTMTLAYANEPVYYPVPYSYSPEISAKIYTFTDATAFEKTLKAYVLDQEHYRFPDRRIPYDALQVVFDETLPTTEKNYLPHAGIPGLEEGYYLIKIETESTTYIDFTQVSPYSVYYEASDDHTLIWCLDSVSGNALSGLDILIDGVATAQTQTDGVAVVEGATPKDFITISTPKGPLYLPVNRKPDWHYTPYYRYDEGILDPFVRNQFLYTDRSVYKPSETIHFYGMVRLEDGKTISEVTLKLMGSLGEPIATTVVTVDNFGTYTGTLDLPVYESYFRLEAFAGERAIGSQFIQTSHYVKPAFFITAQTDKKVLGPRASLTLSGEVLNFDETPAIAMPLEIKGAAPYGSNSGYADETVTTDANGGFALNFTPKYIYDTSDPFWYQITTANKMAENKDNFTQNDVLIFPSDVILNVGMAEDDVPGRLRLTFETHALKLPLEPIDTQSTAGYIGAPLDKEIQMTLEENYFEQIETGEVYDPILKINVKQYEYKYITNNIDVTTVYTENGYAELSYAFNPARSYRLYASLEDVPGHTIRDEAAFYGTQNYASTEEGPAFKPSEPYVIGAKVQEELLIPDNFVRSPQEKTLFLEYRKAYTRHTVASQPKYVSEFTEDVLPNYVLKGIFFDGKRIRMGYQAPETLIRMAETEKQLTLEIETDQTQYKPGDTVKITVKTSADGKVIPASFVLSVVDEAYFAVFPETLDAHGAFYTYQYDTGIKEFYHTGYAPFANMAEMGGAEGVGDGMVRSAFKDTAAFLTGTTDASGVAKLTFELPHNITAWRLTLAGVSGQYDVGTHVEKRVSTLPFYGRLIMGETYIKGEKPSIMLRAGGADIDWEKDVQYSVVLSNAAGPVQTDSANGLPKAYTKIAYGDLAPGDYTLTVSAKQGDYQDVLAHTFKVVDSKVAFSALKRDLSSNNFVLSNSSGYTTLSLWHTASKALSQKLWALVQYNAQRLEWMLSGEEVMRLTQNEAVKPDLLSYFTHYDGGIKPLINASPEVGLTALVAALEPGYLDKMSAVHYFRSILSFETSEVSDSLKAYWGLASMGEPVLYELILLDQALTEKGLAENDRILLGNAFAALGAYNRAYELYTGTEKDASALDAEYALQLAYLGAQLGVESADTWYTLAESKLPERHTLQLLQLMYLKSQHKKLTPVDVQYRLDNKDEKVTLDTPWPVHLAIPPQTTFAFTGTSGEISVDENYDGNLGNVSFKDIPGYSITRTIDATQVSLSGLIEVTLTVNLPWGEEGALVYETIPSGFSVVEPRSITEERQLTFYAYGGNVSQHVFKYTLKAKQEGSYIFEPTIMTVGHTHFEKTEPIVVEVIQ